MAKWVDSTGEWGTIINTNVQVDEGWPEAGDLKTASDAHRTAENVNRMVIRV